MLRARTNHAHAVRRTQLTRIPEDLHPNSLHAALGHNTNLWASVDPEGYAGEGGWKDDGRVVGVGSKSSYGLGGRPKSLPSTYVPGDPDHPHPNGLGKGPFDEQIASGELKLVD